MADGAPEPYRATLQTLLRSMRQSHEFDVVAVERLVELVVVQPRRTARSPHIERFLFARRCAQTHRLSSTGTLLQQTSRGALLCCCSSCQVIGSRCMHGQNNGSLVNAWFTVHWPKELHSQIQLAG